MMIEGFNPYIIAIPLLIIFGAFIIYLFYTSYKESKAEDNKRKTFAKYIEGVDWKSPVGVLPFGALFDQGFWFFKNEEVFRDLEPYLKHRFFDGVLIKIKEPVHWYGYHDGKYMLIYKE